MAVFFLLSATPVPGGEGPPQSPFGYSPLSQGEKVGDGVNWNYSEERVNYCNCLSP